jgi:hypothetical protein
MNFQNVLAGAVAGFLAALIVDLNAWKHAIEQGLGFEFDWKLALVRWVTGIISGALAGLGISNL